MKNKIKEKPPKPDNRKIPLFFKAIGRGERDPDVFYCYLLDDDGFGVLCFGSNRGELSIFKERVLCKTNFRFVTANTEDFSLFSKKAISRMKKDAADKKLDFEASEYEASYAEIKYYEFLKS